MIDNFVLGAAKGSSEVVKQKYTIARTPRGQSLKRNVEGTSPKLGPSF